MSRHRISPQAGWVRRDHPRGPSGRYLCRWCKHEVPAGRVTFCSDECVHQHKLRSDPGYCRQFVLERDQGICGLCGVDTLAWEKARDEEVWRLEVEWKRTIRYAVRRRGVARDRIDDLRAEHDRAVARVYELYDKIERLYPWSNKRHLWEMDHTVPVTEGGGECGLDNLRTLCLDCHRKVTRELAARTKRRRQIDTIRARHVAASGSGT